MSDKPARSPRSWLLPATLILGAIGVLLLLYHTRNGPGITGDSVHYVMGAENLLAGNGYSRTDGSGKFVPITGFPPGFSIALTPFMLIGLDTFQAGRILNAILFGLNIALIGFMLHRYTGSMVYPLIGSALLLLSEDLLHIHSWVMSEGLYIALTMAAIWVLAEFFDHDHRWQLWVSAILIAAAILTRYVGISLVGVGVLALFVFRKTGWKTRILESLAFSVIALIPLGIWFWRNGTLEGTAVNRVIAYHPISLELIQAALGTVNAWFFPIGLGLPTLLRGGISLLILMIIPALFLWRHWRNRDHRVGIEQQKLQILPWLLLFYIPIYLAVLVLNSTFLDASTSVAGMARYLAPVFVAVVLYLLCAIYGFLEKVSVWKWPRILSVGAAIFFLALSLVRMVQFVSNPGPVFRYTDMKRRMPGVVAELQSLDSDQLLISNDIELVYVLIGRSAHALPIMFDHYIQREREDFDLQLELAKKRLEEGAIIVFFGEPDAEQAEVLRLLRAKTFLDFPGAKFLGIIEPSTFLRGIMSGY